MPTKDDRRDDYDRRMRSLRRWRRLIILGALIACVAVTPGLRKGLSDALHLSALRFGGGRSVLNSFSDWLDTFSANRPEGEDILLVNRQHPLPEGYDPGELVCLYEMRHSFRLAAADIYMSRPVYEAMERMFAAAEADGVNAFIVTSGYRTRERQQEIYAQEGDEQAAPPGCSEHETGLSFDVTTNYNTNTMTFEDTQQYKWLIAHCAQYGFILRYPRGKEAITGFAAESWHYRYVGEAAARYIMARGITLEEYLSQ